VSDHPNPAHSLNQQGLADLGEGRCTDAIAAFEQALDAAPDDVGVHTNLAVALARAGRFDEALAACEQALLLHRSRPGFWRPVFGREVAQLSLMLERRDYSPAPQEEAAADPCPGEACRFTILLGCYGDYPHYSVRALDSLAAGRDHRLFCDILIGLNACGRRTIARARELADAGDISGLVESPRNLNKDPMLRLLLDAVRTPYVVWLDDDTHFTDPNWPAAVAAFLAAEHPFDVAGQMARWGPRRDRDPAYMDLVRGRPWWRGNEHHPDELRESCPFVIGGLFIARTAFLRRHDYPDRGMVKALDDVLLGELVQQVGGRMIAMPPALLQTARIGDGDRRGENYLLVEGGAY
jgi:hypothetical protein